MEVEGLLVRCCHLLLETSLLPVVFDFVWERPGQQINPPNSVKHKLFSYSDQVLHVLGNYTGHLSSPW